jgi:hypothetical protein
MVNGKRAVCRPRQSASIRYGEGRGELQRLTIQPATHQSAQDLCSALSDFDPELGTDGEERYFVSVELGSDQRVVEVLNVLQQFVDSRVVGAVEQSVVVALDERRYTIREG